MIVLCLCIDIRDVCTPFLATLGSPQFPLQSRVRYDYHTRVLNDVCLLFCWRFLALVKVRARQARESEQRRLVEEEEAARERLRREEEERQRQVSVSAAFVCIACVFSVRFVWISNSMDTVTS